MKLKVNPEYHALLPQLDPDQYEALKKSIADEGQHYPIAYNTEHEILDGHNRYKICIELNIEPLLEDSHRVFEDKVSEKQFVLETNLLRRHLDVWHRIMVAKPLLEIYHEKAEHRRLSTLKQGDKLPIDKFLPNGELEGKALEHFAKAVRSNPETVRQALWIEENAPEKIPELEKGTKIGTVYKAVEREKEIAELKELQKIIKPVDGLFDVIVVDPPWNLNQEYDAEHWRGACPYPEMELDKIEALKLPMTENCVVWLWTTNAFLHNAYHVLEAWQLTPKSVLTWAKDKFGLGVWLRGQTEHCIMAVRGKPKINLTNQTTLLQGKAREHSQKPEEFYQLVDSLCFGAKLDYFARTKREGWEVYGTLERG